MESTGIPVQVCLALVAAQLSQVCFCVRFQQDGSSLSDGEITVAGSGLLASYSVPAPGDNAFLLPKLPNNLILPIYTSERGEGL